MDQFLERRLPFKLTNTPQPLDGDAAGAHAFAKCLQPAVAEGFCLILIVEGDVQPTSDLASEC